ncbi:MAG: hypothetical protein K2X82_25710 [Gemmataceae bacterium]|nr:hypothetical protein [Gemmataceae bacterium]
MSRVMLDAATLAQLAGRREVVELVDEAGNVVGHYVPPPPPAPPPGGRWWPFTDEDVAAALAPPDSKDPGRPLADVLREAEGR